jgi:hypothetical protein
MSTTPTRLFLGFLAGFLSHLIFQGGFGSMLYAAHLLPAPPWSLMPVPPLGVPQSLNLGFWAGLWGLAYAWLEPRLTALFGPWWGGLVFGLAPLVVYWFVVLPLRVSALAAASISRLCRSRSAFTRLSASARRSSSGPVWSSPDGGAGRRQRH